MATVTEKINFDDGIEYAVPAGRRPPGGVQIRKDPQTGADVFMYKRRPGIYYSANGLEVSVTMAKRAGFDTDFLALERKHQQDLAQDEALRRAAMKGKVRRVIAEYNGFRLDEVPNVGYHVVKVDDESLVTRTPAPSEQMGRDWLADFAGPPPSEGFDGTPESVKVVDGNVQRDSEPGVSRADRRPRQDATAARNVR